MKVRLRHFSRLLQLKMDPVPGCTTGASQCYVPAISVPEFLPTLEGRARLTGRLIGVPFGEGFTVERPPGVEDVMELG